MLFLFLSLHLRWCKPALRVSHWSACLTTIRKTSLSFGDILHLMSVQDEAAWCVLCRYSGFGWAEKMVKAQRRRRLCAPHVEADAEGTWSECVLFSFFLFSFFWSVFCLTSGELGYHNRNRLQESPAAIWCPVLSDCRLWQIERMRSIKMMLYRLVFLKGITVHLGRENDSTTHCRLMWLED